jgi:hypothetical protein
MARLSKDKAEWHYEKLLAIHNFKYLTLAQKVSIFYHDLEHDILKEITGKKIYFDQLNWLKDNQIRFEKNIKKGYIRKSFIDDIDNLKNWRNEGVHENNMPEPKYRSHFHTMAQTILFFSEIPWPDEINNIIIGKIDVPGNSKKPGGKKPELKEKTTKILGKKEAIKRINNKFFLNINSNNSAYSSINASGSQWSFTIDNSKFEDNFYIILEDQEDKNLYCIYLEKGVIKPPKKIFNQRNDERRKNASIIIIKTNDRNFTNNFNNNEFQFRKYLKAEIKY